jgi:hypothetical protein
VAATVADNDFQILGQLGQIARQWVAHLDGRFQARRALLQHVSQVLPGMLTPGEIQPDARRLSYWG